MSIEIEELEKDQALYKAFLDIGCVKAYLCPYCLDRHLSNNVECCEKMHVQEAHISMDTGQKLLYAQDYDDAYLRWANPVGIE